ncbi:MAG: hypothetical protein OXO48_13585 [Caldilineaceae bacterium]|nr:hypothetical protein [Caldilineaceae bacterium]
MEVLFFLLWFIFCPIFCGIVASNKDRSVVGWVFGGLILGVFALIWVLLLPPIKRATTPTITTPTSQLTPCPFFAESIRKQAVLWRFCGSKLAPPSRTS